MYNRYVPQSDGSYRCSRIRDQKPPPGKPPEQPLPCPPGPEAQSIPHRQPQGMGCFFRQLIPKGFDTEDLIIVLLLLLMAGDCQEDRNTAMLTLALYLFMGE